MAYPIAPSESDDENLQMLLDGWQSNPDAHADMLWIVEYASLDMDPENRNRIRNAVGIKVEA